MIEAIEISIGGPKTKRQPKPAPAAPTGITRADAVRQVLAGRTLTAAEATKAVQALGRADDQQQVGTMLCRLRMAGETEKLPDGKWRLVA